MIRNIIQGFTLLFILGGPLVVILYVVTQPDELAGVPPDPIPAWVSPTEAISPVRAPATALLTWSEVEAVAIPEWSGLVTELYVHPGDIASHLGYVAEVDGIKRLAVHSDRPFYRSLARGAAGDDVQQLQLLLLDMGYELAEPDGSFGADTERALREWLEEIGAPIAPVRFDPGYTVWLPAPDFEVDIVTIRAGVPAPSPGADLLVRTPRIVSAAIDLPGGAIGLDRESELLFITPTGTRLALDRSLEIQDPSLLQADVSDFDAVALSGTLEQVPTNLPHMTIPASAVYSDSLGSCLVVRDEGGRERALPIEPLGSSLGVIAIRGLDPRIEVLANPSDIYERPPTCSSG